MKYRVQVLISALISTPCFASGEKGQIYEGIGSPVTHEEIRLFDIDVRPDGLGLPSGQGSVQDGREIYLQQCAACHGDRGQGSVNEALVQNEAPDARTIGNHWPYATTIFDYIKRAMPYNLSGSLSDDEVYSLTAYLLYLNNQLPADATIDADTLPAIEMPARSAFVPDDRKGGNEVR